VLFTRLRLSGFKSFVDSTELAIEPGVTGIVGPNGCGKSNLVEALRWVMGETSAKRMRGDDMDDVIFGGSGNRPARNLAEVGLALDNRDRTAPVGFNEADDLEITRRIERGSGSDYRINGKLVRARDVQLLFADNASGANSPALVSQGKVGQIINAKPQDRRQLLEEAAGITGLHSRRHEAELRLKAAEANLTRLDDVVGAMETQLVGLKKQAKQAARYRNLSEHIRKHEAVQWRLRWLAAQGDETRARGSFAQAETLVRNLLVETQGAGKRREAAACALPPLRQTEAAAVAALQKLTLAREQLDAEERRVKEEQTALSRQLAQLTGDVAREEALAGDAAGALERLLDERERLIGEQEDEALLQEEAEAAQEQARDAVDEWDRRFQTLTRQVAEDEAKRAAAQRLSAELESRLAGLSRRAADLQSQRMQLEIALAAADDLTDGEIAVEQAEERLETAREAAEAAERARHDAEPAVNRAREKLDKARGALTQLAAEEKALRKLLAAGGGDLFPPMVDAVTVAPGYEAALAAALRDELTAPLDEAAAVHWRTLPAYDENAPLPEGAAPLSRHVQGPPALARALAHIGVVNSAEEGDALAAGLAPGQVLVSRAGAAWRWDGLAAKADAPTAAAIRLQQRNRLKELEIERDAAEEALALAEEDLAAARQAQEDAVHRDRQARDGVRDGMNALNHAREALARLQREADAQRSRLAGLAESLERTEAERDEAAARLEDAQIAEDALPDPAHARNDLQDARAALAERRAALTERQGALDRLTREADLRRRRLAMIEQERGSWSDRAKGAGARVEELKDRAAQTEEALAELLEKPAEIAERRRDLSGEIAGAERSRSKAGEALAAAEQALRLEEDLTREAESRLSDAREARARAEAAVQNAVQQTAVVVERIAEKLNCRPEQTLAAAELTEGEPLPPLAEVEAKLEKLTRERDSMGAVNLLAESEAAELEAQITGLHNERKDLTEAISRLRQGIASLNKEARERLTAAFDSVNQVFQEMFSRLFGGGKAHLELVNADDPLESGLEIFASPPGKKLQILSLLSGGEQALTALSLLFAVFRSNPAPICVLDEVDAPLDDANVSRFCDLVEDMARDGKTRFLVITHHRLTMARVDRLFGVTMSERGVSQLVSVDLQTAAALRGMG
jgi:chromosome segregation protein